MLNGAHVKEAVGRGRLTVLACVYIALLMIFGGGGTPSPVSELVCEILAAMALLIWLWAVPRSGCLAISGLIPATALIVALPAIQLLPLPPLLWHVLPGRADLHDALALIGQENSWRALSIAPFRTLQALLSLGPPLLALALASQLDHAGRRAMLKTIAVMGVVSVSVGAIQIAAHGNSPFLFYSSDGGALYGFQANRNSQADILLIALLALIAAWLGGRGGGAGRDTWPGVAALGVLLLLGVVLTTSRFGIALIPVALGCAALMMRGRLPRLHLPRGMLVATALATATAFVWAGTSPAVARVLARFDFAGEYRIDIWRDAWYAAQGSWPVGTGLGTFEHAVFPAERLEAIGPTVPNRAHNELLELLVEGGLPALGAWLAAAGIVIVALRRALASIHGLARLPILFAGGTLFLTGLHAIVDYPFRSMALAGLIGVAAGFALATGTLRPSGHSSPGEN